MAHVKIAGWACGRCGHKWKGRIARKPIRCPKCSSTTWDANKKS